MVIAAIYGAGWLLKALERATRLASAGGWWRAWPPDTGRVAFYGTLVALVALLNLPLKNPFVSAVRYPERPERVAVMERMRAMIPPDAAVAATSFLAPHLLPRLEIYYIPGGPMHHQPDEADYAFIDARAAGLRDQQARGNDILGRLLADPAWELLDEEDDLYLLRRR